MKTQWLLYTCIYISYSFRNMRWCLTSELRVCTPYSETSRFYLGTSFALFTNDLKLLIFFNNPKQNFHVQGVHTLTSTGNFFLSRLHSEILTAHVTGWDLWPCDATASGSPEPYCAVTMFCMLNNEKNFKISISGMSPPACSHIWKNGLLLYSIFTFPLSKHTPDALPLKMYIPYATTIYWKQCSCNIYVYVC